jgi:hypothetical protein
MVRASITAKATARKAQISRHNDNAIFWPLADCACGAGVHARRLGAVETQRLRLHWFSWQQFRR